MELETLGALGLRREGRVEDMVVEREEKAVVRDPYWAISRV